MVIFFRLLTVLCMLVVAILAVINTKWFNEMPQTHKYKELQAFNVLVFWVIAVWLIVRIAMM